MRFPNEHKFDVDMAQAVNRTPQHIHDTSAHDDVFKEQYFRKLPFQAWGECEVIQEALSVKQADPEAFGYTPDCVRCKHAMKYGPGRINMPRSDQCRTRIAEALRGTEVGRKRLNVFETRTN